MIENFKNEQEDLNFFSEDPPEFLECNQLYLALKNDTNFAMKWMYEQNRIKLYLYERTYSLLPTYNMNAKYITIDTDALYQLLHNHYKFKKSVKQFGQDQEKMFRCFFRIPKRLFAT